MSFNVKKQKEKFISNIFSIIHFISKLAILTCIIKFVVKVINPLMCIYVLIFWE